MSQTSDTTTSQELTCLDNGFEIPKKGYNLTPNDYNIGGAKCKDCPIITTCRLKEGHADLCFEGLHKMLMETNIFSRINNSETLPEPDQSVYAYINGMLYLLKTKKQVTPYIMQPWERMDLVTYFVQSGSPLSDHKYGAVCRMFGRLCMQILRDRGYGFEQ